MLQNSASADPNPENKVPDDPTILSETQRIERLESEIVDQGRLLIKLAGGKEAFGKPKHRDEPISLSVEQLRERMKRAAKASGLTLLKIGKLMGYQKEQEATNKVHWLLNRDKDPSFLKILKFCQAVRISILDLISAE